MARRKRQVTGTYANRAKDPGWQLREYARAQGITLGEAVKRSQYAAPGTVHTPPNMAGHRFSERELEMVPGQDVVRPLMVDRTVRRAGRTMGRVAA